MDDRMLTDMGVDPDNEPEEYDLDDCYWMCDLCGEELPCVTIDEPMPAGWTTIGSGLLSVVACPKCSKEWKE